MKITVYGPGCQKCKFTEELVRGVIAERGVAAEVEKVSDPKAMAVAGVLLTPAVAVDGVMKISGRVPTREQVAEWISKAAASSAR